MSRAMGTMHERRAAAWPSRPDSRNYARRRRPSRTRLSTGTRSCSPQFESRASAAGAIVVRAQDAETACAYICDLARERSVDLVVKSKSMTTEEIHLGSALERSRGDRGGGRPGRADHPTGRRTPQSSRGSGHPQEQGRDHPAVLGEDGHRRSAPGCRGAHDDWCERICASTSCRPAWGSRARTSPSPRPGPSSWSRTKATRA